MSARRTRGARGRPSGRRPAPARSATPTHSRLVAVRVLERVERAGAYADLALAAALGRSDLVARDRAFVTEIVYGTLRWRGRLDATLGTALDRDPAQLEPLVRTLLRLGTYELSFHPDTPAAAVVDQAVRCARAMGAERATGLVNAVLRRLARSARDEKADPAWPELDEDPLAHLVHALSIPEWIAARWIERLGPEEAAALAVASNQPAPVTVRANPTLISRDALLEELRPRFPDAIACTRARYGVSLGHGGAPGLDPAFVAGRFTVQDEASQLVVDWLDPQPGERILDLCAAPGTKSTAIAERIGPKGQVVAVDRSGKRLGLVGRAARRLGLTNLRLVEADATRGLPEAVRGPYDRVLVDAPCSGLGTLRRNPDARWRIEAEAPAQLAQTQLALLQRGADALGPAGTLVYSTCTVLREENEGVIAALCDADPAFDVTRGPADERFADLVGDAGTLCTWPHRHGMDGFFAARLARRPETA